ncbi:MAG TPA: FHA domain-containing protein [Vicinamibacteria bacterium]|nr:FHA domain-containing protein [Vicinamibacteria bacterium]
MPVACPSCGHAFEPAPTGAARATARCPSCGRIVVVVAHDAAETRPRGEGATVPFDSATEAALEPLEAEATAVGARAAVALPAGKRISLAVLSGARQGEVVPIEKPRTTLGRAGGGADVQFDDAEMSRAHAALEWIGGGAILRDLGSTNGSFVAEEKVQARALEDKSEFRLGHTRLLLVITDRE